MHHISRHIYHESGFIALMSAIVISVLLLAITLTLGLIGFFGRFNVFDSESKQRSSGLAEACADKAILETSKGAYSTNKVINVGPTSADSCTIISATKNQPSVGQSLIKTQAVINKAYTNLKIIVDSKTFTVQSWDECPNLTATPDSC